MFFRLISSSSSSLVLILHRPFSSFVGPKNFLNIFLSNIKSFWILFSFKTHISQACVTTGLINVQYSPESIQPFWISQEPVAWPLCNLAASQRRIYCASANTHSPVGLVSQQWDAVDWACVLCDRHIHNDQVSRSASSWQCTCPFYGSCAGLYSKASHHPDLSAPLQPRFGSLRLLAFPKAKIAVEREEICKCDGHTVHKLSQQRLTADWLAPRENDCSRTHSKVSSDWLLTYIQATCLVLKIFKMAGYFPDSPHITELVC